MEAQRAAIMTWADRKGLTIPCWFEDQGVSGGADLENRPGLLAALTAVRELGAGSLVSHKADRIARDVYTAASVRRQLQHTGAVLMLVEGISGTDPYAVMAQTIADAAAELERSQIRARTKAALAVKRSRGEKTGGSVPFGSRLMADGVHLEPDPVEHPILLRILELRRSGLGGRRIAQTLINEGHQPRGSRWNPGNLQVLADHHLQETASRSEYPRFDAPAPSIPHSCT